MALPVGRGQALGLRALLLRQHLLPLPRQSQPLLTWRVSLLGLADGSCPGGPGLAGVFWAGGVQGFACALPGVKRSGRCESSGCESWQVHLYAQVMLAGGVALALGLAGLPSSPRRAGRQRAGLRGEKWEPGAELGVRSV